MTNELLNDPSPYLQQHKDNPVFWKRWSKETLKTAKENKKPILLSIGYASCHWCHVMAHESFEDKETANLMNKFFINIKVDREERPDLDFVFQSSFQLFNQTSGGWPLTVFLDENGVPFMAGTYFPKEEKNNLPSFKNVILKISEVYSDQREKILNQSSLIKKHLELQKNAVINQSFQPFLDDILNGLDPVNGGYKGAPKFPIFNINDTLLYFYRKNKEKKFLSPVALIIKKLCSKGIYDHVEGGIARYTVDESWLIPHFEKMLYDNAQFVSLVSKYLTVNPSKYFEKKLIKTIHFMKNNFHESKFGLLGSAYDADSDGEEGKYYIFDYNEIKNISNIEKFFEIKPEGNWEGKIILNEIIEPPDEIIHELFKIRQKKNKPFFDDKTQLDLNSLWLSSLISSHYVLPKEGYLKLAEDLYSKIEKKFMKENLFHSFSKDIVFLEDYAFLIQALLDLNEATMNIQYKLKAKELAKKTIELFYLKEKKIFQKNKIQNNDIFIAPIDISDNTTPNGNSIMLINLTRLGMIENATELASSLNGYLNKYKVFMASSIKSIDFFNEIRSGKKCGEEGCQI
tara:strand:- start:510 stop:2225 length:1716 start_codon:yes stop_codon:yes gene_type:complete